MTELERWSPIVAYCVDETKKIYNSMSDGLLNRCKECCLKLINTDRKFREAADNYLNDEYEKLIKRYDAAFEDVKNKIIFSRVAYRMSIKEKEWETKDKSRRFATRLYINNLDLWDRYCSALNCFTKFETPKTEREKRVQHDLRITRCNTYVGIFCDDFYRIRGRIEELIDESVNIIAGDKPFFAKHEAYLHLLLCRENIDMLKGICEAYICEITPEMVDSVVKNYLLETAEGFKFQFKFPYGLSQGQYVFGVAIVDYEGYAKISEHYARIASASEDEKFRQIMLKGKDDTQLLPTLDQIYQKMANAVNGRIVVQNGEKYFAFDLIVNYAEAVSMIFHKVDLSEDQYDEQCYVRIKEAMCRVCSGYLFERIYQGQKFTFIDPYTNGQSYQTLRPLLDCDKDSHKYVTSSDDIEQEVKEFHEKLRKAIDKYSGKSIIEYNSQKNTSPDPYHTLVVFDFPLGWNKNSIEKLEDILRNGSKYGFSALLHTRDEDDAVLKMMREQKNQAIAFMVNQYGVTFLDLLLHNESMQISFSDRRNEDADYKKLLKSAGTMKAFMMKGKNSPENLAMEGED